MAKLRWLTICLERDDPFESSDSEARAKEKAKVAILEGAKIAWVGKLTAVYSRDIKEDLVTEEQGK